MYQIQTQHVLEIRGRAEHGGHQNSVLMGNTHPPPGLGWLWISSPGPSESGLVTSVCNVLELDWAVTEKGSMGWKSQHLGRTVHVPKAVVLPRYLSESSQDHSYLLFINTETNCRQTSSMIPELPDLEASVRAHHLSSTSTQDILVTLEGFPWQCLANLIGVAVCTGKQKTKEQGGIGTIVHTHRWCLCALQC